MRGAICVYIYICVSVVGGCRARMSCIAAAAAVRSCIPIICAALTGADHTCVRQRKQASMHASVIDMRQWPQPTSKSATWHATPPRSTRSELVVPLVQRCTGAVVAVLDVDSNAPAAFDSVDATQLEALAAWLVERYGDAELNRLTALHIEPLEKRRPTA